MADTRTRNPPPTRSIVGFFFLELFGNQLSKLKIPPFVSKGGIFNALSKLISRILFNTQLNNPPKADCRKAAFNGVNNHLSVLGITAGIKQPTKFGLALK